MHPRPSNSVSQTRRKSAAKCRAFRVMTLFLGAWMMLMTASAGAWAMDGAQDECCCGDMSGDMHADEDAPPCEMMRSPSQSRLAGDCMMSKSGEHCSCQIEQGGGAPVSDALALSSTTFSFAPAIVGALSPHISIPQPRAPSAQRSTWLFSHSPPEPLYLRHQTFLI